MMPTDARMYFYQCTFSGVLLKPKQVDCCVFVPLTIRLAHLFKKTEQVARSPTVVGEQNLRIHQAVKFFKSQIFQISRDAIGKLSQF